MNKEEKILKIYHKYIKEIYDIKDITEWCKKITVTEAVMNPERTNEQKVLDALKGRNIQAGDKHYMYFALDKSLKLVDTWDINNPDHDAHTLLKKLYKTLDIFKNVIDIKQYPKYHLVKQKDNLKAVIEAK